MYVFMHVLRWPTDSTCMVGWSGGYVKWVHTYIHAYIHARSGRVGRVGTAGQPAGSFLVDVISRVPELAAKLQTPRQVVLLYEAVGRSVAAGTDLAVKQKRIADLLRTQTARWREVVALLDNSLDTVLAANVARDAAAVLLAHERVAW
eukprot:GHVU01025680.1.p2 GENE.GHVU01025680.1~~GHVU01025680.1.p2  ORF type:complete len:148 (+),score=23.59 GHVU01025680.1:123-566(+)